jgi:hypothetical protein
MFASQRLTARRRACNPFARLLEERTMLSIAIPQVSHELAGSAHIATVHRENLRSTKAIVPDLSVNPTSSSTTVPSSGDVNPYGLALVPAGFARGGTIHAGQYLVSNFNNSSNIQGTGKTIVVVTPGNNTPQTAPVFYTSQSAGLSLALGVLRSGFVVVGNVPTTDGTFNTIGSGSIQIINKNGQLVQTLSDPKLLDGPWAMAVNDRGNFAQIFVSNVESGTVSRINLKITARHGHSSVHVASITQIASGYLVAANSAAVIVGPGGLAYDAKNNTLYVAATGDNQIRAIRNASRTSTDNGVGTLVYSDPANLRGPIGLTLAPNGDLLTTNDDAVNANPSFASELIEFTPTGHFVGELSLNPAQGAAFGVLVQTSGQTLTVATVDDATNSLDFRRMKVGSH